MVYESAVSYIYDRVYSYSLYLGKGKMPYSKSILKLPQARKRKAEVLLSIGKGRSLEIKF